MKFAYASRTGNVESLIRALQIEALYISDGNERIQEEFILFTYTDGFGDVPYEVENFLKNNKEFLKGVIVSGDQSYGEAYCLAGDVIAKEYAIPCLYKVENEGNDKEKAEILSIIKAYM